MATRYVKELLQAEIVLALATSPATDSLSNTYTAALWDRPGEAIDPDLYPCAVVQMPVERGGASLSPTICRMDVTVAIDLRFSDVDPAQADQKAAELAGVCRTSLAAYWSANLRILGVQENTLIISEKGWGNYGQDVTYRLEVSARLFVPTTQTVDDGL